MRDKTRQTYGRVHMLGPASFTQWVVDLLRVGRSGGRVCLARCLSSVLVCGVVGFLILGLTPAFAEASIVHRPEGYHEREKIADNYRGKLKVNLNTMSRPGIMCRGLAVAVTAFTNIPKSVNTAIFLNTVKGCTRL